MHTPIDRPFALPVESIEIIIDLPFPTSTNRLHGRGNSGVYRRSGYVKWLGHADQMVLLHRSYPKQKITGNFEATLLFDEDAGKNSDLDNRLKSVLDWAVSREIVTDDRFCRRIVAQWVPHLRAPHGCVLILRSSHA